MKSIRAKILASVLIVVIGSLSLVGGISIYLNYASTIGTLQQTMLGTAKTAADRVAQELNSYMNIAYEVGSVARLASPDNPVGTKVEIINQRVKTHGFTRGDILSAKGVSITDRLDYSNQPWFARVMAGEAVVSDPMEDPVTGQYSVFIAAPLWEGGIPDTKAVGVVFFVPPESMLCDIAVSLQVSDGGSSYILNKDGITIAHKNIENVRNRENTQRDAQSDAQLANLAALEKRMTQGDSDFGEYSYGGVKKFLAFAPVAGTDGWSIGINAPFSDFMGSTRTGIIVTLIMLAVAILVGGAVAFRLAKGIGDPIKACANRLHKLAQGDLKSPVPTVHTKDETAVLSESTSELVIGFGKIIQDIHHLLTQMSEGNFAVNSSCPDAYVGDFSGMLESLKTLKHDLSAVLASINIAADQVSSGADQVSSGAQALSQGATEQASSVEELAATINEISSHIQRNAQNAQKASGQASQMLAELDKGKQQMRQMTTAMTEINNTSGEIGKIIKTIEDIAFQTNILALNAAVEAARAGAAGKGFAVVADEVRNLASKSAEASKNTAALIESSIRAVSGGSQIAQATALSIEQIAASSEQSAALIHEISKASQDQAESVAQVTMGIDQISAVVQTNSATSEESAAASEELSAQAQTLKGLVSKFQLEDSARQMQYS